MDDWETIRSVEDAHDLLVRSDLAAAGADGHVPARNLETTRRLVRNGAVHGLRREGPLVVTVALLEDPTFQPNPDCPPSVAAALHVPTIGCPGGCRPVARLPCGAPRHQVRPGAPS